MKQVNIDSESATAQLAKSIAHNLKGGETIELVGDLGSGKTTFTRYLVEALGGEDVTSPSFTISNIYKLSSADHPAAGDNIHEVWHFDFYRLSEPGVVASELAEAMGQPDKLVVVEWAQTVEASLPIERLKIEFTTVDDSKRRLQLACPDSLKYIMDGVK